jgi:hypothetical protein
MDFDAKTIEMVRESVANGRYDLLYTMVPADDGGQTYEMKCKICGEFGNILAARFIHHPDCPVEIAEQLARQAVQK